MAEVHYFNLSQCTGLHLQLLTKAGNEHGYSRDTGINVMGLCRHKSLGVFVSSRCLCNMFTGFSRSDCDKLGFSPEVLAK